MYGEWLQLSCGSVILCSLCGLPNGMVMGGIKAGVWLLWLLASGFVYVQAFVVAHTVGWNIGAYAMMIPSILLIEFLKPEYIEWSTLPKYQMLGMLYAVSLFWFVILPATVLYFYQMKNNDTIQN